MEMKPIKISLSNTDAHILFKILSINIGNELLFPWEKIVMSEIMSLIHDRHHKQEVKIKLLFSQSFIIFKSLSAFHVESDLEPIINQFTNQIEEQLFKKSELGFQLLKNEHSRKN